MARHPYRRLRSQRFELPEVGISELDNIRSLHLGSDTIQSSMNLDNPAQLVLSYSQAMMAWLLFCDTPRHITQIGLGGGSFARWLDAYLPEVVQLVVEINPQVIHVARALFELPFEEPNRFEIIEADGAEYIKTLRGQTDILLVDGFDGEQIVDALVAEEFFANCRQALSDDGIFVTNWWQGDKRYPYFVARLVRVFGKVLCIPAQTHGNVAVLAFNGNAPSALGALRKKASKLVERYNLDFSAFLNVANIPAESTWSWKK